MTVFEWMTEIRIQSLTNCPSVPDFVISFVLRLQAA